MVLMWYAQLAYSCGNAVEDIEEGCKFVERVGPSFQMDNVHM